MPAAIVSWPKLRRVRPSSLRIFAMTGSDEMLSAVARNSANTVRCPSSPRNCPGSRYAVPRPNANGTTTLPAETSTAARPSCRMSPRSVSNPVSASSMRMPTQPITSSIAELAASGGNSQCAPSGHSEPRTVGPSSTPAKISPITLGCPIRSMSPPSSRASASRSTNCTKNTSSRCSGMGMICTGSPGQGGASAAARPGSGRTRSRRSSGWAFAWWSRLNRTAGEPDHDPVEGELVLRALGPSSDPCPPTGGGPTHSVA